MFVRAYICACIKCIKSATRDVFTNEMKIYQANPSLKRKKTQQTRGVGVKYCRYSDIIPCCVGEKALERAQ